MAAKKRKAKKGKRSAVKKAAGRKPTKVATPKRDARGRFLPKVQAKAKSKPKKSSKKVSAPRRPSKAKKRSPVVGKGYGASLSAEARELFKFKKRIERFNRRSRSGFFHAMTPLRRDVSTKEKLRLLRKGRDILFSVVRPVNADLHRWGYELTGDFKENVRDYQNVFVLRLPLDVDSPQALQDVIADVEKAIESQPPRDRLYVDFSLVYPADVLSDDDKEFFRYDILDTRRQHLSSPIVRMENVGRALQILYADSRQLGARLPTSLITRFTWLNPMR